MKLILIWILCAGSVFAGDYSDVFAPLYGGDIYPDYGHNSNTRGATTFYVEEIDQSPYAYRGSAFTIYGTDTIYTTFEDGSSWMTVCTQYGCYTVYSR
jgi:hypothetical protein